MKFLVLNHSIKNYTGSEINAIQLCQGLKNLGHEADLGTFISGAPLSEILTNKEINCFNLLDFNNLEISYDVIWAHHSPVLNHLIFKNNVNNCLLLFSSLSPIHPLEAPPYYSLEIPIFLSMSEVNSQVLVKGGIDPEKIHLFPNFAPLDYFKNNNIERKSELRSIGIISNNKSNEIQQLIHLLEERGIKVYVIGSQGKQELVDDKLLHQFDLVITIGKTVQYCMALRIPVYVYDHFGGPGYLTTNNYNLAKINNFSGRGFNRFLDANQLLSEILSGYYSSLGNLEFLLQKAKQEFCLETNLNKLIKRVENIPPIDIQKIKKSYPFVERINDIHVYQLKELISLENQYKNQVLTIENLNLIIENLNCKIMNLQYDLNEIRKSISWKIFYRIEKKIDKFFPVVNQKIISLIEELILKLRKKYYSKKEISCLIKYGFFDEKWYVETNPDVVNSRYTPIDHFLIFGIKEGRKPNKDFSFRDFFGKYAEIENKSPRVILDYLLYEISSNYDDCS